MGRKVNCSKAWDLGLQSIIQSKFVKIYEQLENHPVTLKLVFIGIFPPHYSTLSQNDIVNTKTQNTSQRLWFFQWSCMDVRAGL